MGTHAYASSADGSFVLQTKAIPSRDLGINSNIAMSLLYQARSRPGLNLTRVEFLLHRKRQFSSSLGSMTNTVMPLELNDKELLQTGAFIGNEWIQQSESGKRYQVR